jgi:hypothetical protein
MKDKTNVTSPDPEAIERIRIARESLLRERGLEPIDPTQQSVQVSCGQWTHFDNG